VTTSPVWEERPGPCGALAVYESTTGRGPAAASGVVVVAHGFPPDRGPRGLIPASLVSMSESLASQSGFRVVACCLRGVGMSEGDFSLNGWLDDLSSVVEWASLVGPNGGVWIVGSGLGGALALCVASADPKVRGVAALSAPATFSDWVSDPAEALSFAIEMGVIGPQGEGIDPVAWARPFAEIDPLGCAGRLEGRSVLVLHGSDDEIVPVEDARRIFDAVGDSAELRVLQGAGHRLNSDPRAVALILGWLERQRV
jgi:uncharacterized protein